MRSKQFFSTLIAAGFVLVLYSSFLSTATPTLLFSDPGEIQSVKLRDQTALHSNDNTVYLDLMKRETISEPKEFPGKGGKHRRCHQLLRTFWENMTYCLIMPIYSIKLEIIKEGPL